MRPKGFESEFGEIVYTASGPTSAAPFAFLPGSSPAYPTVEAAQKADRCRICGMPPTACYGNTFLLHYGQEYAHQKCVEKAGPPRPVCAVCGLLVPDCIVWQTECAVVAQFHKLWDQARSGVYEKGEWTKLRDLLDQDR